MEPSSKYYSIVHNVMGKFWVDNPLPTPSNPTDLEAGLQLLTQIAVKNIAERERIAASNPQLTLAAATPSEVDEKISIYVQLSARSFAQACSTGFPFSKFPTAAETALKRVLSSNESFLYTFMTQDKDVWLTEQELDENFGEAFRSIGINEVCLACKDLISAHTKGDLKAGYYLLWLIKYAGGCSYQMPPKEEVDGTTVSKVLSAFFSETKSTFNKPVAFLEILMTGTSAAPHAPYLVLLNPNVLSNYINFLVHQFAVAPADQWQNKNLTVFNFLGQINPEGRKAVAARLMNSKDQPTAQVGHHLIHALEASTIKESAPHFRALQKLVPFLNHHLLKNLFHFPAVDLYMTRQLHHHDPVFTKQISLEVGFFTHGSLMIGVCTSETIFNDYHFPSYLMAFDKETEELVWGVPLNPTFTQTPNFNSNSSVSHNVVRFNDQQIAVHFSTEKVLRLIDLNTGELTTTIEMPEAVDHHNYDQIHLTPQGFAYQMIDKNRERVIMGGKIENGKWNHIFEHKTPSGMFKPLSSHCGFILNLWGTMTLYGPFGGTFHLKGCTDVHAIRDKLFTIEEDASSEVHCFLTIRTLRDDSDVVSEVEKRIRIQTPALGTTVRNFNKDGQLALLSENIKLQKKSLIFVDLKSGEITLGA